jgi:hypothetical protein
MAEGRVLIRSQALQSIPQSALSMPGPPNAEPHENAYGTLADVQIDQGPPMPCTSG